jgi:transposase
MQEIGRVGVDLAKSVIQVNAVDGAGNLVTNRQLSRDKFLSWCSLSCQPAACCDGGLWGFPPLGS